MTDGKDEPTVSLTFPKSRCKDVDFKGEPFVTVDTGMTAEELIQMILRFSVTGEPVASVLKEASE